MRSYKVGQISFKTKFLKMYLGAADISNPMLGGSLVTTAWHVLRLQMEERASRYGG
jgi:hypothetical protein